MVRGEIFWQSLTGSRAVEHSADDWAVDVAALDGKADNTSTEHVENDHYPVVFQRDRFTALQIQTP